MVRNLRRRREKSRLAEEIAEHWRQLVDLLFRLASHAVLIGAFVLLRVATEEVFHWGKYEKELWARVIEWTTAHAFMASILVFVVTEFVTLCWRQVRTTIKRIKDDERPNDQK